MNAQSSKTALTLYTSPFTTEKFCEVIDWKTVIKMLKSNKILRTTQIRNRFGKTLEHENERKQFIELLKHGCRFSKTRKEIDNEFAAGTLQTSTLLSRLFHNHEKYMFDKIEVKYFYDKKKTIGRVFPSKSLSLCSFRRPIRHLLAKNHYLDIDIVNCHFKIADEIFNKKSIQFPLLHDYVIRRNHYLQLLCDHINEGGEALEIIGRKPLNIVADYDILKECFLIHLYYGTWEGWRDSHGFPPVFGIPDFLTNLQKEFQEMAALIKTDLPNWVKLLEDLKKNKNPDGTIVSWFLQEWERRILEVIKAALKKEKQISAGVKNNCVLCFDGVMIEQNDKNHEKAFQDKVMKNVVDAVQKAYDIVIELKIKPFDREDYDEEIESIEIEECEDNLMVIDDKDDKEAATIIYDRLLSESLYYCKGAFYLKSDHKWIHEMKTIKAKLLQMILESNIYTKTAKGDLKCYCQSVSNANNVLTAILSYVSQNPNDALYHKFHATTKGKICYSDGVLFLKEKQFKLWSDPYFNEKEHEIYSTILINRKFAQIFENRESREFTEAKQEIRADLFQKILGDQSATMFQQMSRAMAGHYEDKDWALWIGARNCGKGCINDLLSNAFEKYISNLPSNCLLHSKFSSKDTKEHSWMIDLQFPRITLVQEVQNDGSTNSAQSSCVVDGIAVKSICSGGDEQKSRKNYQDEIDFVIATKLFLLCNDLKKIEPQDCLETCIQYNSGKQFKSETFIENRRQEIEKQIVEDKITDPELMASIRSEMNKYLKADDDMKTKCKSELWGNAFPLLLMDNYVDKKLEPSNDSDLRDHTNVDDMLNKNFLFTTNPSDVIYNDKLRELTVDFKLSFQKFKNTLIARGCEEFKSGSKRGLKFIKEIPTQQKEAAEESKTMHY